MVDCQFIRTEEYRKADLLASGIPIAENPTLSEMREKERSPFGERLEKAREHARLTQTELAERVGRAQSTIAGLEKNGQGSAVTPRIARVCKVRVEWLAEGTGPMLPNVVTDDFTDASGALSSSATMSGGTSSAVADFVAAIRSADRLTRLQIKPLLDTLCDDPAESAEIGRRIQQLLDQKSGESGDLRAKPTAAGSN